MRLAVGAVAFCVMMSSAAWGQTVPTSQELQREQASTAAAAEPAPDVHAPLPLWPNGAPGAKGKAEADIPAVSIYLPSNNPTQTAVIVVPGGSYQGLSLDREGLQVAQWLNAHGIAALVLRYRLGLAYHTPEITGDGQRAVRYARAHAAQMGVRVDRIGIWGFSAGGHLAASVGTLFDAGLPTGDQVDHQSSRPDFLVLAYPVISMEDGVTHENSRRGLLGDAPDAALKQKLSADEQVTAQTPPAFLFSTTDDDVVPVKNSVLFYSAMVKAGVPVEMHLFQHGQHGVALAQADGQLSYWPDLLYRWLHANGWAE